MSKHVVVLGECMSSIAADYARSLDSIWQKAENSRLRNARPIPNCLLPGDSIYIPDPDIQYEEAATGRLHRFQIGFAPAKQTLLRIRFLEADLPRPDVPFSLDIDGTLTASGNTDANGLAEVRIPGNASEVKLTLNVNDHREVYLFDLGTIGPVGEWTGARRRLINLGYPIAEQHGAAIEATRNVLRRFQKKYQLPLTGAADEPTCNKLRSLHDESADVAVQPRSFALVEDAHYGLKYPDEDTTHQASDIQTTMRRSAMRTASGFSHLNTLNRRALPALLEVEDTTYHTNSAVTLPVLPTFGPALPTLPREKMDDFALLVRESHPVVFYDYWRRTSSGDPPQEELWRRSSLVHVAVLYLFALNQPSYRLLLSGHTDSTGDDAFNMQLAQERADNFYYLLIGDRGHWLENCLNRSTVEDYQRILAYYATVFGMDCDPGAVDNQLGDNTRSGIRGFQRDYNQRFGKASAIDGVAGREFWGAIFDMYMMEIALLLGTTPDELGAYRANLRFVDHNHPTISCGERIPVDEPQRKNFRSKKNRRVQSLFFPSSELPDLKAHLPGGKIRSGTAGREASAVYGPGADPFVIIIPRWWTQAAPPSNRTPQFRIEQMISEDTYSEQTEIPFVYVDPVRKQTDPWAFLEPYEETNPPYFDPDLMNERYEKSSG